MKNLKTLKAELLASAETRAAYDAQADEFAVARELIAARTKAGLTQADVAERMGTTQSTVARLEGGKAAPSLRSFATASASFLFGAIVNKAWPYGEANPDHEFLALNYRTTELASADGLPGGAKAMAPQGHVSV